MSDKGGWTDFRTLQRRVLLLLGYGLPALGLTILLPRDRWPWLTAPLLAIWLGYALVLVVLTIRLGFWPCPRCGKSFFLRFGLFPTYSGTCPHCRLPYGG